MKKVFLIAACVVVSLGSASQPIGNSLPQKIKILSWNIYMLPPGASFKNGKRAEAIGKTLANSDYDIIVFQEAFCPLARYRLRKELSSQFPYTAGPANRRAFSLKTNSGLWIFSKHPIINSESIIYRNRKGIDALSRKGALLAEVSVNGNPIQIIATHLQNSGDISLKKKQCVELAERLVERYRTPGIPQIICGDFNINRNTPESYQFMLASLDAVDGDLISDQKFTYDRVTNDLQVEKGSGQDLIDYILLRENGALVEYSRRSVRVVKQTWHPHHQDLSDHYPLEAEIHFTNFPTLISAK